jgi:hypothetical protein
LEKIPHGYTSGLWYAKWSVDGIDCATFIRIGNSKAANPPPANQPPAHIPAGMIAAIVPLDPEHSENMLIPDPRIACVKKEEAK